VGLRAQKKEQTRQLIGDAAWQLFADRGFPSVTVAEIAREAGVSTATVFNYFPIKEDLFFPRLESFGDRLVEAVASRPHGESALDAVRHVVLDTDGLLGAVERGEAPALDRMRTISRVIADSPALQLREQRAIAGYTAALADVLAQEAGTDGVETWTAANALIGVQRGLIDLARRRILADERVTEIAADVRAAGGRAFALLERGLTRYP